MNQDFTQSRIDIAQTIGEAFILPGYAELETNTNSLQGALSDFLVDPEESSLFALQDALKTTRISWQAIAPFQFGPAETSAMRKQLNTYPVDTDKILSNIESQDYTLGSLDNVGAEGFPAIGFMISGLADSPSEIVDLYKNDSVGKYGAYLTALTSKVLSVVGDVSEGWAPDSGNYIASFTGDAAQGTDVGSSLSIVVNAYEFHLQRFLRDGKVGIPAGVRSAGVPRPLSVEAYYGEYSTVLLDAALRSMKDIYTGSNTTTGDKYSLEDYLITLDFEDLASEISLQFDRTIELASTLNDPLSIQIENDNQALLNVFLELQKLIPLIKSDMASAMAVIITNQDADGD